MPANLIVGGILLICVFLAVRHVVKTKKAGGCVGCSGCSGKTGCPHCDAQSADKHS